MNFHSSWLRSLSLRSLALQLLLSIPAFAVLDQNNNGMSDIWERQNNNGNLFANNILATNDEDNDGWNNAKESVAGTNPFQANPPDGIVAIKISPSLVNGAFELSWHTIYGKCYQLEASTDLAVWFDVGEPITFVMGEFAMGVNITQPDNSTPPKLFWRIKVSDADTDSDTLTDAEEFSIGSNYEAANTLPGISDFWMAQHFTNEMLAGGLYSVDMNVDSDNDGSTNAEENLNNTDPNTADAPTTQQWFILNGDSEENVEKTCTKTLTIPAGKSALLVIAIASDEFPFYTDPESTDEYDDQLRWNISPNDQPAINGEVSVNDRHYDWDFAILDEQYLPGIYNPVHYEKLKILTAPADEDLTIEVVIGATNIGDGRYPSQIAVGLEPIEINSLDRFVKGSINISTVNRIFSGSEGFGLTITGETSEKNIGFADLDEAYIHSEGYLNSDAEAAKNLNDLDPRTWQQEIIYYIAEGKLHFITTFDQIETLQLKLYKYEEEQLSSEYTLTSIPDVADLIQSLDQNFREAPFANNGIIPPQYIPANNVPAYDDIFPEPEPEDPENPEEPVVNTPPAPPGFTDLEWRNLTTRCLDVMFIEINKQIEIIAGQYAAGNELLLKQLVAFGNGFTDGIWGGLKSDWSGLVELKNLMLHPIDTVKATIEGFKELLGLTSQQWKDLGVHMFTSMIDASKEALPWELQLENAADQIVLHTYIISYGQGFLTEQACMVYLGVGAASKIGQTVKVIIQSSKVGRLGIELAAKGLSNASNIARKTKTSAQRYWSQFAESKDEIRLINAHLENSHRRPGMPGADNSFVNSQKALGEALEELDNLTAEKLLKELGDADEIKTLNLPDVGGRRHIMQFQKRAAQLATTLLKSEALTEDALIGFARLYKRLIKNEELAGGTERLKERVEDLAKLFDTDLADFDTELTPQQIKGAKALAKSLEDYKVRSEANDFDGKFWFKDVEKVYQTGYIYHGESAYIRMKSKNGLFEINPNRGNIYTSFDKYVNATTARDKLQVLIEWDNSLKYRFEYDTDKVKNSIRLARGEQDTAPQFELLARDYPKDATGNNYSGGGTQALIENDTPIKAVYKIENGVEVKVWDDIIGEL